MIALQTSCLLFRMANGESVPFSSEMVSVEVTGESDGLFDAEQVRQAAASVFHYFRHDLGRETVSVAEFAEALEKVLRDLGLKVCPTESNSTPENANTVAVADLRLLAHESGQSLELFFYPRLRHEMRRQLDGPRQLVRFRGLRGCVKQLAGARRWCPRCEQLQAQILEYLRQCLSAEAKREERSLMVE